MIKNSLARSARWQRQLFFLSSVLILSCSLKIAPTFATPGAINGGVGNETAVSTQIAEMESWIKGQVVSDESQPFARIGHRGGRYDLYPKKFTRNYREGDFAEIGDLMDLSFQKYQLTGIELDVQALKTTQLSGIFISHDPIDGESVAGNQAAMNYLKRNSLLQVLSYFVEHGYHHQQKKILIELKVNGIRNQNHPQLTREDLELMRSLGKTMRDFLQGHPADEVKSIVASVNFVGFNLYSLLAVHEMTRDYPFEFYLIATTNRFLLRNLAGFAKLPALNDFLLQQMATAKWLTGVWFDPKWVKNFTQIFNDVNEKREERTLRYFISTYGLTPQAFKWTLQVRPGEEKLQNVGGMIVDIHGAPLSN